MIIEKCIISLNLYSLVHLVRSFFVDEQKISIFHEIFSFQCWESVWHYVSKGVKGAKAQKKENFVLIFRKKKKKIKTSKFSTMDVSTLKTKLTEYGQEHLVIYSIVKLKPYFKSEQGSFITC